MAAENNLGKDKVSRLVWRIAIPSMLGQFVSVLYSIVDRMYIGNIPEIGDVALAGVGVCGPVVTMVGSVAVLVGVGGAPLVSIRMGEEDLSAAKKVLANCFLMLIVFSENHTAQDDWPMDRIPALYTPLGVTEENPEEIPEWRQPLGSEDAYHIGDRVKYQGKIYECTEDNNVWAPDVRGWTEVAE